MKFADNRENAVKSAVMIVFFVDDNRLYFPLIKWTEDGLIHGGQVSFPGGKSEKNDADIIDTAIRETWEEVGLCVKKENVIGQLTNLFIPVSNYEVTPVLAFCEGIPIFKANATEVQYVILSDLNKLLNSEALKSKTMDFKGQKIVTPYYDIDGEVVWGATAMILTEIMDLLAE